MCELSVWSDPMTLYLWCGRLNIVLGILLFFIGHRKPAPLVWFGAALGWAGQSACFLTAFGLTFLSGIAATFTFAGMVLCIYQLCVLKSDLDAGLMRPKASGIGLIILALFSMVPEAVRHDTFMMSYAYAKAFFFSRPLSLGVTFFALACAPDSLWGEKKTRCLATARGRLATLLAGLIFLAGEIAGCYWGFVGWGTTWRWSGNFQFSATIFVLFMVPLHIPRSVFPTVRSYALALYVPLTLIALGMAFNKVVQ